MGIGDASYSIKFEPRRAAPTFLRIIGATSTAIIRGTWPTNTCTLSIDILQEVACLASHTIVLC